MGSGSTLRAAKWPVGDFEEGALRLGKDRAPHFGRLVAWSTKLVGQQTNDRFERDAGGREMNPLESDITRQAIFNQVGTDLRMCGGVRVERVAKIVVSEYPAVPFPVQLVLVAGGCHLEPAQFFNRSDVEANREPEIAPVRERQGIMVPAPPPENKFRAATRTRKQPNPALRREDGEPQKQMGQFPEGVSRGRTTGFVGFR